MLLALDLRTIFLFLDLPLLPPETRAILRLELAVVCVAIAATKQ